MNPVVVCAEGGSRRAYEDVFMKGIAQQGAYNLTGATVAAGDSAVVGIDAESPEDKDPLIRFNITRSIDGATGTTVYTEDFSSLTYEHDETIVMDTVSGQSNLYTFTVTNRDGLIGQVSLTLTVQ